MRKDIRRKKWFYTLAGVGIAIGLSAGSSYVCGKTVYAASTESEASSEVSSEVSSEEAKKIDYMVFQDSDTRILDRSDIFKLSNEDIRIAKNEIYARHGRRFSDTKLQTYFDQMSWYSGTVAPEAFDSSCLNEIEACNASFLDEEQKAGTGLENASVVENEIEELKQSVFLKTAQLTDRIGLDSFTNNVSVLYKKEDASDEESKETSNEASTASLDSFYEKDGEIFGNIGFHKNIGYINEGSPCTWYNGHEYRLVRENSVASDDYSTYTDTYVLYEDDTKLLECQKNDEHAAGGASTGKWLLTKNAIYSGDYQGMTVYDWSGNVIAESDEYVYAFDAKDGKVYMRNCNDELICADEKTLANPQTIDYEHSSDTDIRSYEAYGKFVYKVNDVLYQYDTDEEECRILDSSSDWNVMCTSDKYAYGITYAQRGDKIAVERISYDTGEKEIACIISGAEYAGVTKAEGTRLYMYLGTSDHDWTSDTEEFNMVTIAIDFETGIVEVLAAGWYS